MRSRQPICPSHCVVYCQGLVKRYTLDERTIWLEILLAMPVVLCMFGRSRRPAFREDPLLPVWQVETRMIFDEEVEKDGDEDGAGERVG